MSSEVLKAEGIRKSFGKVTAVAGIDLTIQAGEFLAIVGRSGSGKSTLLNLLAGLDSPDSGRISSQGRVLPTGEDDLADWRRAHVGLVFQAFHLIPTLSALENVAIPLYPQRMSDTARREQARKRLEQVGLGNRTTHRPGQLSGGEQQRVAIARALVGEPSLVLADEPTGNLDTATGQDILDMFQRLRHETGFALVVVTHDEKVAAAADRQIRLQDGVEVA
ncbi:ABC transporter ATP-binding protein [Couchioplanes caeruleus]|uniref:Macrolide ABC transporter ATP-binding protein n=2 Tax=Couchioplanes caeruleus TaxID=56438 RepID=A0A1K0FZQ6_9ACTN|nr:ABC transporter ATP-binding protein [Couchioplanes caeruleus]OJF10546.1 macrolide ABC transporter ATP-binding protein [Couchioplanes caeruleus subsp. caeruleus]ROP28642.1 putative ABC transport system ATP-binding protein [Couchioplanes caeruleus]